MTSVMTYFITSIYQLNIMIKKLPSPLSATSKFETDESILERLLRASRKGEYVYKRSAPHLVSLQVRIQ